jgi:hypothetical protein
VRHLSSAIGIAISVVASTAHIAVAQNNGTPPANSDAAPAALSWHVKDVKDAMTDAVTHKMVSYVDFPNGTSLEASAKCSALGVEFTLGMYSGNEKPSSLAWKDDTTQVRVRIDGASVRVARVAKEYINAARLVFYDPDAAMNYMERSVSSLCKKDELMCSALANAQIKEAMDKLRENAPGTLDVLAKAASVRVELVLADGTTNVFDLNLQDQALKTLVQQCASGLHTDRQAGRQYQLKVTCETATANSDNTQKDEPVHQGIYPVDKQETGNQTGRTWYHITVDGQNFWIKEQPCVTLLPQAAQRSGELAPSLPFAEPKDVTLVHPTQVYLSANDSRGITAKGKLTILGQSQFANGFYCIVRVQIDKQYKTGLIGIDILGSALDPSQRQACYMPHGAGGVELTTAN